MKLSGCWSAREVLWHLVFWGFAVNYMVRINLSIAIVSMVRTRITNNTAQESECFVPVENNSTSLLPGMGQFREDVFLWDEYQQSLILGAFFWLHWLLQVPGGILAQKFGTKIVFGFGNLIMCVLGMLTPAASHWDYRALVFLRALQGLVGGVCWPSMHNMTANWIPPNERSKFVTAYLGSSVGAGLTFPLCGLLIDWFDWPAAFHATGLIGITWFLAWWFLVYDTPALHPRIDELERQYIEESLGRTVLQKKAPVPWRSILTSGPMWITSIAQVGGLWGLFTLLIQAPTYLKTIHGWDIRMTGILSGVPHFCRVGFAYIFSTISDNLLKKEAVKRNTIRKTATAVCTIGQGVFIFGLALCGCNWLAAIFCVTMATMLNGAVSTGPLAILVDLSPNYASILLGLSNMIGVLPGFLSPILVGALTYQNQTIGQWQKVFFVSVAILVIPGLMFLFCATSNVQPWNNPELIGQELVIIQEKQKQVNVDEETEKDKLKQVTIRDEEKVLLNYGKVQEEEVEEYSDEKTV